MTSFQQQDTESIQVEAPTESDALSLVNPEVVPHQEAAHSSSNLPTRVPQVRQPRSRRIVVRRPTYYYEEEETIDISCQEGYCRPIWKQNSDCSDVFADHDSHNGDQTVERAFRPGVVRSSSRVAEADAAADDRVQDFVQRVLNNESSEDSDDLPPMRVECNRENCNCVAHSDNSVFDSQQSDETFVATPTILRTVSRSPATSDSGM